MTFVIDEEEGEVAVGKERLAVAAAVVEDGADESGERGRRQEVPEFAHEGNTVGKRGVAMGFGE